MGELEGKVALVTGSTSNIGLAAAETFAREGATVIVHSRHLDEARAVADRLGADALSADLADAAAVAALFADVGRRHGRLDVLLNCVARPARARLLDVTADDWAQTLAVNLTGALLCTQHAAGLMRRRGGVILHVTAASAERASPGSAAYSISKAALNGLVRQAAVELAEHKIRVNAIVSGIVGTPVGSREMGSRAPDDAAIPLRRIGRPEEVAEAAAFLASDRAAYITNAFLAVDGGRMNAALRR